MGNLIYADSSRILTPSAVLKSSEVYSADNVKYYLYPYREWSSTSNATNWVGYNLGSALAIKAVVIDNYNSVSGYTKVYIDCDTAATFDSDGGNPAFSSGELTLSRDENSRRYKLFYAMNQTYQYIRARYTGAAASTYLGSLVVLSSYVTLDNNVGFPIDVTSKTSVLNAGSGEPVQIGKPSVELTVSPTHYQTTSGVNSEFVELGYRGKHTPLVIYLNNSSTAEVYICHRTSELTQSLVNPGIYTYSPITFREVGSLV